MSKQNFINAEFSGPDYY